MSTDIDDTLLAKLKSLPPDRRAEVEDFIDFLSQRITDQSLVRAAERMSEPALRAVWDNPDDAEYDKI